MSLGVGARLGYYYAVTAKIDEGGIGRPSFSADGPIIRPGPSTPTKGGSVSLGVGARLGHYYAVTAKIDEGGMWQLHPATDTRLNCQVALKILRRAVASDPDRLARFQREACVLASLNESRHCRDLRSWGLRTPARRPYRLRRNRRFQLALATTMLVRVARRGRLRSGTRDY